MFLRGREDGTSEPCVGDAEGIAEEEWALKLGVFPVPCCCSFFFGFLEESSPHASLEASSARFVARRVRFYSDLMAHGDDVDGARAAKPIC